MKFYNLVWAAATAAAALHCFQRCRETRRTRSCCCCPWRRGWAGWRRRFGCGRGTGAEAETRTCSSGAGKSWGRKNVLLYYMLRYRSSIHLSIIVQCHYYKMWNVLLQNLTPWCKEETKNEIKKSAIHISLRPQCHNSRQSRFSVKYL